MSKVVLISCVSKKLPYAAPAQQLYISTLFKLNLVYAKSLKPDSIFILSAKYGLVDLDQNIEPYDQTLNTTPAPEVRKWADRVAVQLQGRIDFEKDEIIFLAGERYRKYLAPYFNRISIPLKGLGIGRQLGFLKKTIQ